MTPMPVVVQTLAEEFTHLNQWFGPGRYRLVTRSISYGPNARVYDVVDIATPTQRYRVFFDATRIRPPAPAGAADMTRSSVSSALPSVLLWTAILGGTAALLYYANRDPLPV